MTCTTTPMTPPATLPPSPDQTLFELLGRIPDPRKKRGVRHNFHAIIKLVILGFTARLVCLEHIVEFAQGHWDQLKTPLGFNRDAPPDATTIGRALRKIDREELEKVFREWVSSKVKAIDMSASVDGKALRNVCDGSDNPLFMVNVFAHDIQIALAQQEVSEKRGESTTFRDMLQGLFETYPGLRILTGDAGFAGRDLCREISRLGRHYLVQIKGNQGNIQEVLKLHFEKERVEREPDAQVTEKKSKRQNNGT